MITIGIQKFFTTVAKDCEVVLDGTKLTWWKFIPETQLDRYQSKNARVEKIQSDFETAERAIAFAKLLDSITIL